MKILAHVLLKDNLKKMVDQLEQAIKIGNTR